MVCKGLTTGASRLPGYPHIGEGRDDSRHSTYISANSIFGAASRPLMAEGARRMAFYAFTLCTLFVAGCAQVTKSPTSSDDPANIPPPTPREFRAVWVATVANIDWPSRKDLTVDQQKAEIVAIIERTKQLNLNTIILQVRTSADALYDSKIEPWSEYLTGEQGRAPQPFYDPLAEWIEKAHSRGIELHAWFNPYRARHVSAKSGPSRDHIANTNPTAVKSYGGYLWMDPGEPVAAQRTLDVIMDVVRRYDIDGVHIDDYFYPYPVTAAAAPSITPVEIDFPDDAAWGNYLLAGGKLARADWRRQNVNDLIEKIYTGIKHEKRWVKFGVSPFGLGKPALRPAGIAGFSQYDKLYADVELWLQKGWMDYLVPQLYWAIDQPPQAFGVLLDYWLAQNTAKRHVWPGLYTGRILAGANPNPGDNPRAWEPTEILNQIALTRGRASMQPLARGHVHFSMVALLQNRKSISDLLRRDSYTGAALSPTTPWLGDEAPAKPVISTERIAEFPEDVVLRLRPGGPEPVWQFGVWSRYGTTWQFRYEAAGQKLINGNPGFHDIAYTRKSTLGPLNAIVVFAINRLGNESQQVFARIDASGGVSVK